MENLCEFELNIAQQVRDHIDNIEDVSMKFACINMIENFMSKIRLDIAEKFIYCAGCGKYVKTADRTISYENGYEVTRCGTCNTMHRRSMLY